MNQWREAMKARTHSFAVAVIVFVRTIPDAVETRRPKDQLVGAAWGMNGNWRAACRARTHKEFTAKLGTVVEEADEAEGALNVIYDSKISTSAETPAPAGRSRTTPRDLYEGIANGERQRAEEQKRIET
jgi:four helix bundle protein